jgi:hypothetical protein
MKKCRLYLIFFLVWGINSVDLKTNCFNNNNIGGFMENLSLNDLYEVLLNHCINNGLIKFDADEEKKNSILDNLIAAFVRSEISFSELKQCLEDVKKGVVISLDFFENGGDLFQDYVNPKWQRFAKELFRQRSVGLGTPNAASGMGELMFLFLGKGLKKPKQGDLELNGEVIELKSGEDVRVMSEVRGRDFRIKSVELAKKYNLELNVALRNGDMVACEIEKKQHFNHWNNQLKKLSYDNQISFVSDWLKILDGNEHRNEAEIILKNGRFDQQELINYIIKILFTFMVLQNKFNKFVIINGNRKALIVPKNPDQFNKLVDNKSIIPNSDYFRINQTNPVGWSIPFH